MRNPPATNKTRKHQHYFIHLQRALHYLGKQTINAVQMNIRKIISLNYGERYEDIDDHYSYIHNFSSCEIKA